MKKFYVFKLVLIVCFCFIISCTNNPSAFEAGFAKAKDLLKFFPKDVRAVFFLDINRALTSDVMENILKKGKNYAQCEEFIEEIGIDLTKDIYYIAGAITEKVDHGDQKGFGIINLKYNKDTLLNKIKEEDNENEIIEEEYNGITVFTTEDHHENKVGAFLDKSNIVIGTEEAVKAVIDTYQKKSENVFKNEELSDLIKESNTRAILWGAVLLPSDLVGKFSDGKPMLKALDMLEATTFYFDYWNKNLSSEVKVFSKNQKKNQEIMKFLQGIKALASLTLAENPDIENLLNRIEITSGSDYIQIFSKIPSELLEKIHELVKTGSFKKFF